MSTGGIFTIITNDGKQDRLLCATELLSTRLQRIAAARRAEGMDETPTLVDIEKTHVLFMNAHFKPFAAIGYEYNKVAPSSGTVTLGSTVQFSIPQFGDLFHDMVLHLRLGAVTGGTPEQMWRFCDFPGERILNKTKFTVNGNPLDEYTKEDYCFYRQFELPENKKVGYYRCVGQQLPTPAVIVPNAGATNTIASAPAFGDAAASGVSTNAFWINMTNGYQTVKSTTGHALTTDSVAHRRTDILEVTIPLLFWFNRDPRLSIASVSIPFGQRFIEFDLANLTDLVRGQLVTGAASNGVAETALTQGTDVTTCHLYVNNIFVNPEVHDIFIKRIGFTLIRVHRRHATRITDATNGEVHLNSFKWPIEYIYFGFRDAGSANGQNQSTASSNNEYLNGWHRFGQVHPIKTSFSSDSVATTHVQYDSIMPVVQQVTFKAHGISIYNEIPAIMYNQYFPWTFGDRMCTPEDPGVYAVFFNLHPGVYQPSGHINISRAREFYISFDDTVSSAQRNLGVDLTTADLIAHGCAINFMLVSDGSAVLRYST